MERIPTLDRLLEQGPAPSTAPHIASTFRRALVGLSLALDHALSEEQLAVYAVALADVDLRLLRLACVAIAKTAHWWPKPAEIIAQAAALAREEATRRQVQFEARLPPPDDTNPATWVKCQNCQDEHWILHQCPGGASRTCGRSSKGQFVKDEPTGRSYYWGACQRPHGFAVRCTCVFREGMS